MARKPASDFGWDWGPSYAPSGIHGGVELVGYDNAFIQGKLLMLQAAAGPRLVRRSGLGWLAMLQAVRVS